MILLKRIFLLLVIGLSTTVQALPIRSFTADPVAKNQVVIRGINTYNGSLSPYMGQGVKDLLMDAVMYGVTAKDTLFFMNATVLSDLKNLDHRAQEYTALYRRIVYQNDKDNSTTRLGLLIGPNYQTEPREKMGAMGGGVFIFFTGRNEIDADAVFNKREGGLPSMGFYDISWQYRLMPTELPESGFALHWINGVIEYNGRWIETVGLLHQITVGLQWVQPVFVMEVGGIQDLNGRHGTGAVFGITARFG